MLSWIDRNGKLILVAKVTRTLAYGFLAVVFGVYLSQLGFSPAEVGIAITVTLLSTAVFTLAVSHLATKLGRKRSLLALGFLLTVSAGILLVSENPFAIIVAAILGNIGVGSGETGPFLSVEQAILPDCSPTTRRTELFGLYSLVGYGGSSAGALLAGLPGVVLPGIGNAGAFLPLFVVYLATAIVTLIAYAALSNSVEVNYEPKQKSLGKRNPLIMKLALLFALDAFGGGFVAQSILAYLFFLRFNASLTELGFIFFGTQLLTAISFVAATRIAKVFGLLNTMVFTHLPSNMLLVGVAFAPSLPIAVALLMGRHTLSQMDVPTRQSYVMAIVKRPERAQAAGITNVSRMVSQSVSPSIAGYLIQVAYVGLPILFAGILKSVYDVLIYAGFRATKPPEELTTA